MNAKESIFGFTNCPQKATLTKRKHWRDLVRDTEKNGSIVEQIKNVENEIASPIISLDLISTPYELQFFAFRVKNTLKETFKKYGGVKLERLSLLHFFYAFKQAKIDEKVNVKDVERFTKQIVSECLIKHYIKNKEEILELVKCQPPSDK